MDKMNKYFSMKIGKLQAIGEGKRKVLPSGQKPRTVRVLCDCGVEKEILLLHFSRGRTTSCGCERKKMDGDSETNIGRCYRSMLWRCDPRNNESHLYYDRGITVCSDWVNNYKSFKLWALDNGYSDKLQLDRIDNNKGYSPNNCRFVTSKVNNNNRRDTYYVTYNGKTEPFCILVDRLGLWSHVSAIRARIRRGWSVEDAINKPIRVGNYNKQTKQGKENGHGRS